MTEHILNWVNIRVKDGDRILLLDRQHDNFKGWIQPGDRLLKVRNREVGLFLSIEFSEPFFEAAKRELQEKTGLIALNLQPKGISVFSNPDKVERYVYYDFLCTEFEGELLSDSREG